MPRPTKLPPPEVRSGAAFAKHPTLNNFGDQPIQTQGAVSFFAKLRYLSRRIRHTRPLSWRKNRGPPWNRDPKVSWSRCGASGAIVGVTSLWYTWLLGGFGQLRREKLAVIGKNSEG